MKLSKSKIFVLIGVMFFVFSGVLFAVFKTKSNATAQDEHAHAVEGSHDDHAEEKGHDDHGSEKAHDDHGAEAAGEHQDESSHTEGVIKKTAAELQAMGAIVATAGPGALATQLTLQGTLVPLEDSIAHIVPRIPGVVREVRKKLGDTVRKGEILAILESRDLADVKSGWLAAREKLSAAESAFKREEDLWNNKITSEQEYLNSKKLRTDALIEYSSAQQKIESLGVSKAQMSVQGGRSLTRYEMTSPMGGVVTERHLNVGESTKPDETVFVVAELSKVNAVLQVYPKDLPMVIKGQQGTVIMPNGNQKTTAKVTYVSAVLDPESRSATAHIAIDNKSGQFRPGLFVTAILDTDDAKVGIVVPKESIQKVEGKDTVFVQVADGFKMTPIEIGKSNKTHAEILSGLQVGDKYITSGSFLLKAELSKSEAEHNH